MNTRKLFLTSLLAAATMSATAFGENATWSGTAENTDWSGANWTKGSSGQTIDSADKAVFTSDTAGQTVTGTNVTAANLKIDANGNITFDGSFSFTSTNSDYDDSQNWGTMNLAENAVVSFAGNLAVARWGSGPAPKVLNIASGAVLSVAGMARADESLKLVNNGIFKVGELFYRTGGGNLFEGSGTVIADTFSIGNIATVNFENNKLILGRGGIVQKDVNGDLSLSFGAMRLGASANWSSAQDITFNAASGKKTIIDTSAYDTTNYTTSATEGKTITLRGTLSVNGAVEKIGAGTLELAGTVNVGEGGSITVSAGTLNLSGANVTLASAIANSGTVTVNANTIFVLSDSLKVADTDNTYLLISGGTIEGWNTTTLSAVNFVLSGASSSQRGATVVLTDAGSVTYTAGSGEAANLTWKAGVSGTWDVQRTLNWTNDFSDAADVFYDYDSVKFDTTGDVTVAIAAGGVTADTVTISAGTVSFTTNKVTAQSGFVVENGATLKLKANNNLGGKVTVKTGGVLDVNGNQADLSANGLTEVILAGGKLANNSSTNVDPARFQQLWKITLTADSSIGGVQSNGNPGGSFGIVGSYHGATTLDLGGYKLTKQDGGIFYLVNTTIKAGTFEIAGGTVQLAQADSNGSAADFVLSGGSLDLNGKNLSAKSVSGTSGTITLGAGTLTVGTGVTEESVKTFSGRVDGGSGTLTKAGSGTIVFSGNTTIRTYNLEAGTTEFSGTGTLSVGTLNLNGGTLKVTNGAVLDLTSNSSTNQYGTDVMLKIDGAGSTVKISNGAWNAGSSLGMNYTNTLVKLSNGGVFEVTRAQSADALGAAKRGFSITGGEGTYRYSYTGTSYIADNSSAANSQHIGLANTATLIFDVTDSGATLEVSKVIATADAGAILTSTTGALKKTGAGTVILSGDNKYTGGTVIEAGTVVAAHANALGTTKGVEVKSGTTKGVEVKSGATLNLGALAVTVAGLSGAGSVGLADGRTSSTLTVNGGGVFTGTLSRGEDANSLALVFDADGQTLELNPKFGNLLSSVEVKAGTVKTGKALGLGYSANVTVQSLGTLEFTTSNLTTKDSGLTLVNGGITFKNGASFVVDVTGAATDVALSIITSSVIKFYNGSEDVSLTSDNLDQFVDNFVKLKGWDGLADWAYDGSKLSLTMTIPEPSMFGLLAGLGALALAGTRRRRRKA